MIYVASHRRSGTHLMMEMLSYNFECNISEQNGNKTHLTFDRLKNQIKPEDKILYVVRDPRDVMLSCWEWWRGSNEGYQSYITHEVLQHTFEDYIAGEIYVSNFREFMVKQWEMDHGLICNPLKFWKMHVRSYIENINPGKVIVFKYEDIKNSEAMQKLGQILGLKQKFDNIINLNHPVGYFMGNKKRIGSNSGKWKDKMSKEELECFKFLEQEMRFLGYN